MNIAWGALNEIQIVQILHLFPHLRDEYERWKKK